MTRDQRDRQAEYRKLKKAGFICLRYYGTNGPFGWKLPGKTKWLTKSEALKLLEAP